MTEEKFKGLFIALISILGIETFSISEVHEYVKIICQIIVTACTVYYLLTKTKQLKK